MFYTYYQNNSGGRFRYDPKRGITHYVVIEADSNEEANTKAECIGLYFDGCDNDIDCPCCGDRWHRAWSSDGENEPLIYGKSPEAASTEGTFKDEMPKQVAVHYKDGTMGMV